MRNRATDSFDSLCEVMSIESSLSVEIPVSNQATPTPHDEKVNIVVAECVHRGNEYEVSLASDASDRSTLE